MKELLIAWFIQMNLNTFKITGITAPIKELIIEQKHEKKFRHRTSDRFCNFSTDDVTCAHLNRYGELITETELNRIKTYYTSNSFLTKKLNKRFSRKVLMVDVCLFLGVAARARNSEDMAGKHPGPTSTELSRTSVQPGRINIKERTCKKKNRDSKFLYTYLKWRSGHWNQHNQNSDN